MKSARQTAFEILNKIQRDESYSNLVLDSALDKAEIDIKDKRFVSALVYGVTERRITLDYNLSLYLSQPLKKLKPQVLTALRLVERSALICLLTCAICVSVICICMPSPFFWCAPIYR